MFELCKKLGIETLGDLERFKQEEKRPDETLKQALERYLKELNYEV